MQFGKNFESHLTTEWRQQYLKYAELKAEIHKASKNLPDPLNKVRYKAYRDEFADEFFTTLSNELERVNDFFGHKMAEARRKHATFKVKFMYMPHVGGQLGNTPSLPPLADQLRNVKQLERAYCEFYFSLVLLNNYQQLNYMGFFKICEKFDRYLYSDSGSRWVTEYLELTAIAQDADELNAMMVEVENIYTQYIAKGDRGKAMEKLRVPPLGQPTAPSHIFSAGVLLGLFIVSAVVCVISFLFLFSNEELISTFVRLYRGMILFVVYGLGMAINVYVWQSVGINHVLIFELNPRNHTVPVKLLSTASFYGYICTIFMLLFLHHAEFGVKDPLWFPIAAFLLPLVLLVNPFRIMNFTARMWVLRCLGRILAAPFFHVRFADFWLADQMISLVQCFVDFYQLIRFYIHIIMKNNHLYDFEPDYAVYALRALPSWFRLLQCLRRYRETKTRPKSYLINAAAYGSTLIVVAFSTVQMETNSNYDNLFANPWTWCYIVSSFVSTIYCTAWDLLQDYGLFKVWKGHKIFLRERFIYPKRFYYFAIFADLLIRFLWLAELFVIYYDLLLPYNCKTLSSLCEIIRRFIWNFLRLENEHLYNCGNYRATRDIYVSALNSRDELLVEGMLNESKRKTMAPRSDDPDNKKRAYF